MSKYSKERPNDPKILRALKGRKSLGASKAASNGAGPAWADAGKAPTIVEALLGKQFGLARALIKSAAAQGDYQAIHALNAQGRCALGICLEQGIEPLCELLAREECQPDLSLLLPSGDTALIHAIKSGMEATRDAFIEAARSMDFQARREVIDGVDSLGDSALIHCISMRNKKAVFELLRAGADGGAKNKDGVPALSLAILSGQDEIAHCFVKFAKKQGERSWLHANDPHGEAPLTQAIKLGQVDLATEMLDAGAPATMKDAMLCSELGQAKLGKKVFATARAIHEASLGVIAHGPTEKTEDTHAYANLADMARRSSDRRAAASASLAKPSLT